MILSMVVLETILYMAVPVMIPICLIGVMGQIIYQKRAVSML